MDQSIASFLCCVAYVSARDVPTRGGGGQTPPPQVAPVTSKMIPQPLSSTLWGLTFSLYTSCSWTPLEGWRASECSLASSSSTESNANASATQHSGSVESPSPSLYCLSNSHKKNSMFNELDAQLDVRANKTLKSYNYNENYAWCMLILYYLMWKCITG